MPAWTVVLLAGLTAAPAPQEPAAAAAPDLGPLLRSADALAANGDYAGARAALQAGIQGEAARPAVLSRYGEIRDRLAEWAFRQSTPQLGPAELFAGTVERWKEKQRQVALSWSWATLAGDQRLADFVPWKEDWLFRVPLGEDFTVQIEGAWGAPPAPVSILVGVDEARAGGWRFTPGFHRAKVKPEIKMPRRAERFGDVREVLETSVEGLEEPEGTWSYTLEAKRGIFTLRSGVKKVASWKTGHPDLMAGYVGFNAPGLRAVRILGELDAGAWEDRKKEREKELLETFCLREYDPAADLPEWFRELCERSSRFEPLRPPDDAPPPAAAAWPKLLQPAPSFDFEAWRQEAAITGPLESYARAIHAAHRGAWKDCETSATVALQGGLKLGAVHALLARARFFAGRGEAPIQELESVLAEWPDDAGYELARLTGRAFGPKAMLQALERSIAAGGLSPRVLRTRDRLAALLRGPRGDASARHADDKGKVLVLSDATEEDARSVGQAAFSAREAMIQVIPGIYLAKEHLTILHFSTPGARAAFCSRLGLDPATAGYVPELRVSLVCGSTESPADREALVSAVWEQHLDGTLDLRTAPEWYVAGNRAFFVNAAWHEKDRRVEFLTNTTMAKRLRDVPGSQRFKPAELMQLPPERWVEGRERHEAEAWLVVHFLHRNEIPPYAGRMARYLHALRQGATRESAFQDAFGDLPAEPFEQAVSMHCKAQVDRLSG